MPGWLVTVVSRKTASSDAATEWRSCVGPVHDEELGATTVIRRPGGGQCSIDVTLHAPNLGTTPG